MRNRAITDTFGTGVDGQTFRDFDRASTRSAGST